MLPTVFVFVLVSVVVHGFRCPRPTDRATLAVGMNLTMTETSQRAGSRCSGLPAATAGWENRAFDAPLAALMPPLIPDWRYLTEKNQIALAWFAERIRWSRERFE
jgi:hypothetical protein